MKEERIVWQLVLYFKNIYSFGYFSVYSPITVLSPSLPFLFPGEADFIDCMAWTSFPSGFWLSLTNSRQKVIGEKDRRSFFLCSLTAALLPQLRQSLRDHRPFWVAPSHLLHQRLKFACLSIPCFINSISTSVTRLLNNLFAKSKLTPPFVPGCFPD